MKQKVLFVAVLVLIAVILTGCAKYDFSRAMYEGIQTRDQLQSTPAERVGNPGMNYQQYDAERKPR